MKRRAFLLPDGSGVELARAHRNPAGPQTGQRVGTGKLWVRLDDGPWRLVTEERSALVCAKWICICDTADEVIEALCGAQDRALEACVAITARSLGRHWEK